MNVQKTCTYGLFHIRIIKSAGTGTITYGDVELEGNVYVKGTGRRISIRIFASQNFYNKGRSRVDTFIIQTGTFNMGSLRDQTTKRSYLSKCIISLQSRI